jgi:ribosomal protein L12E/L44/L45/RPP1/RPP2
LVRVTVFLETSYDFFHPAYLSLKAAMAASVATGSSAAADHSRYCSAGGGGRGRGRGAGEEEEEEEEEARTQRRG